MFIDRIGDKSAEEIKFAKRTQVRLVHDTLQCTAAPYLALSQSLYLVSNCRSAQKSLSECNTFSRVLST